MKKTLIHVFLVLALVCIAALTAQAAPYSVDLDVSNAATNVANFAVSEAVKPVNLAIWDVTAAAAGSTAVVSRVHGTYVSTLWTATFASNVTSSSTVLTNAPYLAPGDYIRVTGPTNFSLEVNGEK